MIRLFIGLFTFVTVAASPMLAFAAGVRSKTFDEVVAEKVLEKFEEGDMEGDMRVRVTPTANVCGNRGEGYQVQVLVKVVKPGANGQLVAKLVHVKTYGALESIWSGPKIVECAN
jgi:hypothetical protein